MSFDISLDEFKTAIEAEATRRGIELVKCEVSEAGSNYRVEWATQRIADRGSITSGVAKRALEMGLLTYEKAAALLCTRLEDYERSL